MTMPTIVKVFPFIIPIFHSHLSSAKSVGCILYQIYNRKIQEKVNFKALKT